MSSLEALLTKVGYGPRDRLWFAGDLVNRGPRSLDALRFARATGALMVLGNHDLHLLGRAAGARGPKRRDTLDEVLFAPDLPELLDWLRMQPVLHKELGWALVHAGLLPEWSWNDAEQHARAIEAYLRGPGWREALGWLFGDPLTAGGDPELRDALRAFTLLRIVDKKGEPLLTFSEAPAKRPKGTFPWYAHPARRPSPRVLFGHWAAHGHAFVGRDIALDSGCVWGQRLTALRLQDEAVFQVDASD